MEIAFIDSMGKDSLFYVKRGGSNQSKESVELELQRGFVAWRNEGRLGAQWRKYFLKLQLHLLIATYCMYLGFLPSQLATWEVYWFIELAWQYIAMTRNNLCIISISLSGTFSFGAGLFWILHYFVDMNLVSFEK